MSKLLTLSGDSDVNRNELKNTSHQPITIEPYSRVTLVGINAILADDLSTELFRITASNQSFTIGNQTVRPTATMTLSEDYTSWQFLTEMENAANFTGTGDASLLGLQYSVQHNTEEQFQLVSDKVSQSDATFENWIDFGGTPVTQAGRNFTADAAEETQLYAPSSMPRVSNKFSCALTNPATVDIEIVADCEGDDVFGIRANAAAYQYKTNGGGWTAFVGAPTPVNGDLISMSSYGATVVFTIQTAAGAPKANSPYTFTDQTRATLDNKEMQYQITAAAGGALTNCNCTILGQHTLSHTGVFTPGSKELAIYLGLTDVTAQTFNGNPATLTSRQPMHGILRYPAIMVTLDGLGTLESYNLARTGSSSNNIANTVRVIYDVKNSGSVIQKDYDATYYLDIGNTNTISVNQLRARLYGGANQNLLDFVGYPSISIIIDGPRHRLEPREMSRSNFPM